MTHTSRVQQILAGLIGEHSGEAANPVEALCRACVRDIPVDGAAVSVVDKHGTHLVIGASGDEAMALAELQWTLGSGPSVDAFHSGSPVLTSDLGGSDGRWPGFVQTTAERGVGALFALPLQLGSIRLGTLDLHRAEPGALEQEEQSVALALRDAAMIVLLHQQDRAPPGHLAKEVDTAWMGQAHVHQATGMISVQAQVSLPDALAMLRAHALTTERTIGDVAADVIARRLRFTVPANETDLY